MSASGLAGEQLVSESAEECAARLADALARQLRRRLVSLERVHLALSGGSSGKLVAAALGGGLAANEWPRIHVWMVDERCVAVEDPRLNFGAIRPALLERAAIPPENLHAMPVLLPEGAERYEQALRAALAERPPAERRLDAVILGMGPDGHTASLFPHSPALDERERWIVFNDGDTVALPRPRMTMTFPLINGASFVALFVTGASKRDALRRVAARREDYHALPVAAVAGMGETRPVWFLDRAALP